MPAESVAAPFGLLRNWPGFEPNEPYWVRRAPVGEYLEMPGQRLTTEQASRLWGVDERVSAAVLDRLVEARFLKHVGPYYFRADLGRPLD